MTVYASGGSLITVYIPKELWEIAEEARGKLRMNRSRFIQYCIYQTLQQLGYFTRGGRGWR